MASRDPITIDAEMSDPASVQSVPPIRLWLQYVDGMINRRDIPLMKLCLYPTFECGRNGSDAEDIHEIFQAMANSDDPDCEQAVLYKFICALRVVGGKRRGKMCVAELKSRGINVPNFENHDESEDFRFFQCFARVARDVESSPNDNNMLKEALGRRLKKSHHNFNCLADMFKEIYEVQFVTPEDCTEFCELLRRCEYGATYIATMNKYSTMRGTFHVGRLHACVDQLLPYLLENIVAAFIQPCLRTITNPGWLLFKGGSLLILV